MAGDDVTVALCGPCRHFEQAFSGRHACGLGLPLLDGVVRVRCAGFHPFLLGEGSMLQSDCCSGKEHREHGH